MTGPCPSIRTPFTDDGEIDEQGVRQQIDFMIDAGAKCIILTYGDSLFSVLSDVEIQHLTELVASHVNRRAFVVSATGAWWTRKTVDFARWCSGQDVDMLMVLPPDWGHSCTIDTVTEHYRAVASVVPVMVVTNYLIPRPQSFRLRLVEALLNVPGVFAFKDDVGEVFARRLCLLAHEQCAIIAGGQKQNHLNMMPCGVDGYFSTSMSFWPKLAQRYWRAIEDGDLALARTIVCDIDMPFFDHAMSQPGGFSAVLHGLMEHAGVCTRRRRPPYHTLDDQQMQSLAEFANDLQAKAHSVIE